MKESFVVSTILPVNKEQLFNAWLDSAEHSLFTGGKAKINSKIGGEFFKWDNYIIGTTIVIEPYYKIVQKWRTTEFNDIDENSILEILFDEVPGGTKLSLKHSNIPKGQGDSYKQGWVEHYFEPMKSYFKK